MIHTIWLNGKLVKKDQAFIHHDDSGYLRGFGVFDSILAVHGELVAIEEHYQRLIHDCKVVLRITPDYSLDNFIGNAQAVLKANEIDKDHYARVRTQISGGILKEFLGKPVEPTISVSCSRTRTPDNQEKIKAWVVSDYPRISGCVLENCKKLDYTKSFCAMQDARAKGGNEPILTNTQGNVACASTSSVFIVEGGKIITPPLRDGILDSISRRFLIRDYGAVEESISVERLEHADAIFLSNTIRGVRPLIELNGAEKEEKDFEVHKDLNAKIFQSA